MANKNPKTNEPWARGGRMVAREAGTATPTRGAAPGASQTAPGKSGSGDGGGGAGTGTTTTNGYGTGPGPAPTPVIPRLSRFSEPIRTDDGRRALFEAATFLREEIRDQLIVKANRRREQDPLKLRGMAVDGAISTAQKRRLVRTVESAVAGAGGSTLLQSFPHLADAVLYETLIGRDPDEIPDIEPEDLRGPAEEFVRENHEVLYSDRIRQVLADAGIDVADALIAAIYEDMTRRRVPLPVRSGEGALP